MKFFNYEINNWGKWGEVYQSIVEFTPLVKHIYTKENIMFKPLENLHPGTNAVFKIGNTVCKIFAPAESGQDSQSDYETELFGLTRAEKLGVPAPKLISKGIIHDKYDFLYFIMEYIEGMDFEAIEPELTKNEKKEFAQKLRKITDKLNTTCEGFNKLDVIERIFNSKRWKKLSQSFRNERLKYLQTIKTDNRVYVHGDLNCDNIILDSEKNLYIIDFADALLAPEEYELVCICGMFDYQKEYLQGYFGDDYDASEISEKYFRGLLMHDFGAGIILHNFGSADEITNLEILKKRVCEAFEK